jgi:hypothetical protein
VGKRRRRCDLGEDGADLQRSSKETSRDWTARPGAATMAVEEERVMTEAEWRACDDPVPMLDYLQADDSGYTGKPPTDRKLRLFACACRRQVASLSWEGISAGWKHMEDFPEEVVTATNDSRVVIPPQQHVWLFIGNIPVKGSPAPSLTAALLRDILGNPFRPVEFDAGWPTSTVVSLAHAIYQERAFERMPILADALEDAGCTNADFLNHCRQPGEHVRGCWVVDLVLDKT